MPIWMAICRRPATKFSRATSTAQAGLGCADCHGGDRTTDDYEASMSQAKGFVGKIARTAVPKIVRPLPQRRRP